MINLTRTVPRRAWSMYRGPWRREVRLEPVEAFGIKVMSVGFLIAEDQSVSFPASSASFVVDQMVHHVAWGELDHLVVDLPPGTADVQQHIVSLLRPAGALIVVGSQDAAHMDAKKVVTMLRENAVPVLGGVQNMHALECPHCRHEVEIFPRVRDSRSIWSAGVEQLAELPFEPGSRGPQSAAGGCSCTHPTARRKRLRRLGERVLARLEERGSAASTWGAGAKPAPAQAARAAKRPSAGGLYEGCCAWRWSINIGAWSRA